MWRSWWQRDLRSLGGSPASQGPIGSHLAYANFVSGTVFRALITTTSEKLGSAHSRWTWEGGNLFPLRPSTPGAARENPQRNPRRPLEWLITGSIIRRSAPQRSRARHYQSTVAS